VASERVIFVDETSPHTAMMRRDPRAPRGKRADGTVPRNHGANRSGMGALGLRGMIAAMSVDGAVDTEVFAIFVSQVLVPALQPGDGVRLDNLSGHPASQIEQAGNRVGGAGSALLFARFLSDRTLLLEAQNVLTGLCGTPPCLARGGVNQSAPPP
jgi:hypothetical protein